MSRMIEALFSKIYCQSFIIFKGNGNLFPSRRFTHQVACRALAPRNENGDVVGEVDPDSGDPVEELENVVSSQVPLLALSPLLVRRRPLSPPLRVPRFRSRSWGSEEYSNLSSTAPLVFLATMCKKKLTKFVIQLRIN